MQPRPCRNDALPKIEARLDKLRLDTMVNDEGNKPSAGEMKLFALAWVGVRNSQIIVLNGKLLFRPSLSRYLALNLPLFPTGDIVGQCRDG